MPRWVRPRSSRIWRVGRPGGAMLGGGRSTCSSFCVGSGGSWRRNRSLPEGTRFDLATCQTIYWAEIEAAEASRRKFRLGWSSLGRFDLFVQLSTSPDDSDEIACSSTGIWYDSRGCLDRCPEVPGGAEGWRPLVCRIFDAIPVPRFSDPPRFSKRRRDTGKAPYAGYGWPCSGLRRPGRQAERGVLLVFVALVVGVGRGLSPPGPTPSWRDS